MKKVSALLLVLGVFAGISDGALAQHDLSAWFKVRDGKTTVIPWYVYGGDKIFVDARYNFDAPDSVAIFVGKPIAIGSVQVIPAIGGIAGKYNGISAEVNVIGKLGPISYFTLNQYSLGVSGSSNFVYHWLDLLYPLGKHVMVGVDEQWYWQPGGKGELDVGPALKVKTSDGLYLKGWLAVTNTGSHKFFIGLGFAR